MMLKTVLDIIGILLNVLWLIIIVQAILSWLLAFNVISLHNNVIAGVWSALDKLTEPLYRPIRKIMPDFGALDLSPMVLIVLIAIVRGPVMEYFYFIAQSQM